MIAVGEVEGSLRSQHLLDWFDLTMQLTRLSQSLTGLARLDPQRTSELQRALEHTKWNLLRGVAYANPER